MSTLPSSTFYVNLSTTADGDDLSFAQFGNVRKQIEEKVTALMAQDISDQQQLTIFADIMKQVALCEDFNANHIAFLDTIWNRSREAIHQRHKSLRHYDANSQSIRLNIETDLLYKEMRTELLEIVKKRSSTRDDNNKRNEF